MDAKRKKGEEEVWHRLLVSCDGTSHYWRRVMRLTPSSPRCTVCYVPFRGIGGRVLGLWGLAPSRKNPRYCNT